MVTSNVTSAAPGMYAPGAAGGPSVYRLFRRSRLRYLPALPSGWPLSALLVLYPIWWALGLGVFASAILAVPMAVTLLRRRPIRVPPRFGLWLLFLLWYVASVAMLGTHAPGTLPDFDISRFIAVGTRLVQYLSVTILLLYVGNLSERELPRARVVNMLGIFTLTTVAGGLAGLLAPEFSFTSPFEMVLPASIAQNGYVQTLVHPELAETQWVLGFESARPSAPFAFSNLWGNCVSVLLIWLVVGWWIYGTLARRFVVAVVVPVSFVPIVFSLDRGLWIAILLCAAYLTLRLAARGRAAALVAIGTLAAAGVLAFMLSPLRAVVDARLDNPHSNEGRLFAIERTVQAAAHSPIVGYGNTRNAQGSASTITVGRTPGCPSCSQHTLGADGQLWMVIISQGFVGAALYVSFFATAIWRYRRDHTPVGEAGILVLLLAVFYMLIYGHLAAPLSLYFVSLALLWRGEMERQRRAVSSPVRAAALRRASAVRGAAS